MGKESGSERRILEGLKGIEVTGHCTQLSSCS